MTIFQIALGQLILAKGETDEDVRVRNVTSRALQKAKNTEKSETILKHYKTIKKQVKPLSDKTKLVHKFYNKDNVSSVLPYKLIRRVKDYNGGYHRVAIRVMEVILQKALAPFKYSHPSVKISRRTFQFLRRKNIRLVQEIAVRLHCLVAK